MMNKAQDVNIRHSANPENHLPTAGSILFEYSSSRMNDPEVIHGKYADREFSITLSQLQGIVSHLHDELHDLGIHKGTNIMLVSFPSSSALLRDIYFVTLVSMGAKVFMPRKSAKEHLDNWITETSLQYALIPGKELLMQEKHEEEAVLLEMNEVFINRHVALLDTISSFPLERMLLSGQYTSMTGNGGSSQAYKHVLPGDEALILAFPSLNGNAVLKTFTQQEIIQDAAVLQLPYFHSVSLNGKR